MANPSGVDLKAHTWKGYFVESGVRKAHIWRRCQAAGRDLYALVMSATVKQTHPCTRPYKYSMPFTR